MSSHGDLAQWPIEMRKKQICAYDAYSLQQMFLIYRYTLTNFAVLSGGTRNTTRGLRAMIVLKTYSCFSSGEDLASFHLHE